MGDITRALKALAEILRLRNSAALSNSLTVTSIERIEIENVMIEAAALVHSNTVRKVWMNWYPPGYWGCEYDTEAEAKKSVQVTPLRIAVPITITITETEGH